MKISKQWLEEYLKHHFEAAELAKTLTNLGLEVESMTAPANAFSKVVVAEVESVTPHPDANKLNVCQVNIGTGELQQIVCGAKNVRAGGKFPCALPGADLGGGMVIQKTKLRGVDSCGMLCSGKELGIPSDIEGILPLPEDAPIGQSLRDYLVLNDVILDLKITPNRGDCLSVLGLARDIAASSAAFSVPTLPKASDASVGKPSVEVAVLETTACPRYMAAEVSALKTDAVLPFQIAERLRRSGIKVIHPVVDILNYVMLELGQPLHAFDAQKISKTLQVRYAKAGEKLALLNQMTVSLTPDTLVIADAEGPVAIAGAMGGLDSGVQASTTSVILESAFFDPLVIAGKARHYGFTTDGAHRFERGVDPALAPVALARAIELIRSVCGGEVSWRTSIQNQKAEVFQAVPAIVLSHQKLNRVLGGAISLEMAVGYLKKLNCEVREAKETLQVVPPSYRFDLKIPEDLIEEIARLYGYDRLPTVRYAGGDLNENIFKNKSIELKLQEQLKNLGLQEAITYSFISEAQQKQFYPGQACVPLMNPMTVDMAVMRTGLFPGLVQALQYNLNRQQSDVRLFEIGQCFAPGTPQTAYTTRLGILLSGPRLPEQWGIKSEPVDFYDLKGIIETLLASVTSQPHFIEFNHTALHPGQAAAIYRKKGDKEMIGYFGRLHPEIQQALDIAQSVYLAELDMAVFENIPLPVFEEISKFPSVRRDIAMVVDRALPADVLKEALENVEVPGLARLLHSCEIFDVFEGKPIDSTQKSVAIRLIFQEKSHTLSEDEIKNAVDILIKALVKKVQEREWANYIKLRE